MNNSNNNGIYNGSYENTLTEEYFIEHLKQTSAQRFYTEIKPYIIHIDTWIDYDKDADELIDFTHWRIQFSIRKQDFGVLARRFNDYTDGADFCCHYNGDDRILVTTCELFKK